MEAYWFKLFNVILSMSTLYTLYIKTNIFLKKTLVVHFRNHICLYLSIYVFLVSQPPHFITIHHFSTYHQTHQSAQLSLNSAPCLRPPATDHCFTAQCSINPSTAWRPLLVNDNFKVVLSYCIDVYGNFFEEINKCYGL